MKKIYTLFAALTVMASATMADSGGGFKWTGTGATYNATMNALILEDADLTSLEVASWYTDKTNFGTTFTILVYGSNNKINPTNKIDGITIGGSSYSQDDDIILNINGKTPDAKLEVSGQLNSAIYFKKNNGYLRLDGVDLTCTGRLHNAQYGISASAGYSYYIWVYPAVSLTLDGNTSQLNNAFSFTAKNTSYAISYPAGATMNTESGNLSFSLDGDNYNGKTTIKTGSGIKIGGVELDYTNWDNFTQNVSAGEVSYSMNQLILNNAQIDAPIEFSAPVTIGCHGNNVINGDVTFKSSASFLAGDLTINGNVKTHGGEFTILYTHLSVYAPQEAFTLEMSGEYGTMNFGYGSEDRGSLYMEYNITSISQTQANEAIKLSVPDDYTVSEYTKNGKKCFHARYVKEYGITLYKYGETVVVNSDNCNDVLGDGTVKYDSEMYVLELKNAELTGMDFVFEPSNLKLRGSNRIISSSGSAIYTNASDLYVYGEGSLDIVTENDDHAIVIGDYGATITIKDTKLNIYASGYAITSYGDLGTIEIKHAEVSLQSGYEGLLDNVGYLSLEDAAFVSPAGVEFYDGQLYANDQLIAANTKVVIKPVEEEGIGNVVLTEKAQKVLIDGQVYIVRDNKMFDLTGAQVR